MKRYSPARIAWVASAVLHIGGFALIAIFGGSEPAMAIAEVEVPAIERPVEFLVLEPEVELPSTPVVAQPVEPKSVPTPKKCLTISHVATMIWLS